MARSANATKTPPRWWVAVVAGMLASLPLAWLLSYGAALPGMLGLFFCALFGLLIGAVMCRVASPGRPIPAGSVKLGAAATVMFCWGVSFGVEVREFPSDKASGALRRVQQLPEGMTAEAFRADVERFISSHLENEYGGDGALGYLKWVLTSSRLEYPVATMPEPLVLKPVQYRGWLAVRIVLSILLLGYGVFAQVLPLSKPPASA